MGIQGSVTFSAANAGLEGSDGPHHLSPNSCHSRGMTAPGSREARPGRRFTRRNGVTGRRQRPVAEISEERPISVGAAGARRAPSPSWLQRRRGSRPSFRHQVLPRAHPPPVPAFCQTPDPPGHLQSRPRAQPQPRSLDSPWSTPLALKRGGGASRQVEPLSAGPAVAETFVDAGLFVVAVGGSSTPRSGTYPSRPVRHLRWGETGVVRQRSRVIGRPGSQITRSAE